MRQAQTNWIVEADSVGPYTVDNVLIDKPVAPPSALSNLVATPQQSLSGQSSLALALGPTLNLLHGYRVGCRREVINIGHAQDKFFYFLCYQFNDI